MWLLSADQVADHLTKGSGELDRPVRNGKGDARPVLFGDRPMVDRLVGNRDVAGAEAAAFIVEGAVEDEDQFHAFMGLRRQGAARPDPHQADLAAVHVERIFPETGQSPAPGHILGLEAQESTQRLRKQRIFRSRGRLRRRDGRCRGKDRRKPPVAIGNGDFRRVFQSFAGQQLEAVYQAAISERDARLAAIFASAPPAEGAPTDLQAPRGGFPRAIRNLVGYDVDTVPWKTKLPGFKEYSIDIDGCEASLMWIRPGRALPAHTHKGTELTLILDGAFNDARGRFGPGDISIADESVDHRPVAEKERPCIAFIVLDAPVKLTGSFRQLIGDLIG